MRAAPLQPSPPCGHVAQSLAVTLREPQRERVVAEGWRARFDNFNRLDFGVLIYAARSVPSVRCTSLKSWPGESGR